MEITPELLIRAYSCGVFPMAEARDNAEIYWVDPDERGILPLDTFHVPRSLRKALKKRDFTYTADADFKTVIAACAAQRKARPETWINPEIEELFVQLHRLGLAHSIETWEDGELVGGLYGMALGGAFFGESMFSFRSEASKAALVHLVERLKAGGFTLLDTQFVNEHLLQFGCLEISREDYLTRLQDALPLRADFMAIERQF